MAELIYLKDRDREAADTVAGYTCVEPGGVRAGDVDGVICERDSHTPRYLVVHTGGLFSTRSYVVPAEEIAAIDADHRRLTLRTVTKARLEAGEFPEYDDVWRESHRREDVSIDEPRHLQLIEEKLQVRTKQVVAGSVRLSRRVVEREETVTVPVREEYLVIECSAGDGVIRVGERELRAGESIELPVLQEQLIVSKESVVYQQITVRKAVAERQQQVQANVRREELEVGGDRELVLDTADVETKQRLRSAPDASSVSAPPTSYAEQPSMTANGSAASATPLNGRE